jgi:multicomponent Na+:H+ antiporter subunit D
LIEATTGATDTRAMGGVYAWSTPLSIIFLVLILGISGVPPFLGFWPKLLLLEAGLDGSNLVTSTGVDWIPLVLAFALLLNALLTLIAGTRLWAHVFWRSGPEGALSESPNPNLRALSRRQSWFGIGATAALTLVVAVLGVVPDGLLEIGRAAAIDLLNPGAYVAATAPTGGAP